MALPIQSEELRILQHSSSLYILESIPAKQKLNVYLFDPLSKILKHLYLASLSNLLYVSIFDGNLCRFYTSQESVKLSTQPETLKMDNYNTVTDEFDLIIKINKIRANSTFANCITSNFSISREERQSFIHHEQVKILRQASLKKAKSPNLLFCETLLAAPFSSSLQPINLNLELFDPESVELKRSLFDLKWTNFQVFRQQNCFRILGLEPESLHYKKWSFPMIYPNILGAVIVPDPGKDHQAFRSGNLISCFCNRRRTRPF